MSQISIIEAVVLQRFPQIDAHPRIGEIELDSGAIERLLGHRVAGHEERELLMPLAGPDDLLFADILDLGCQWFHRLNSAVYPTPIPFLAELNVGRQTHRILVLSARFYGKSGQVSIAAAASARISN